MTLIITIITVFLTSSDEGKVVLSNSSRVWRIKSPIPSLPSLFFPLSKVSTASDTFFLLKNVGRTSVCPLIFFTRTQQTKVCFTFLWQGYQDSNPNLRFW